MYWKYLLNLIDSYLAYCCSFKRIQSFAYNLFTRACRKISRIMKQFVYRVAFQIVTHL